MDRRDVESTRIDWADNVRYSKVNFEMNCENGDDKCASAMGFDCIDCCTCGASAAHGAQ